jgi:hypothetical protein
MWGAGKDWPIRFRAMSQLERLGLMRNPDLSGRFIGGSALATFRRKIDFS